MSTSGHLKFQGTNRATFVGATSNIMFDTTSTSLGIGVTGTDHPSSNLYITGNAYVSSNLEIGGNVNMLHTANTASIKINSNVVTEFPRSKKLIRYPRVALTADAQTNSGYQGHFVTRSSQFLDYNAWEAFDENNPVGGDTGAGSGWASTIPGNYSVSTGAWGGGGTPHHTGSTEGEWIQIQLPDLIYLHDFVIESRSEITYGADGYDHGYPKDVVLYGSINGSSWDTIKTFTTGQRTFSEAHTENINETRAYNYFALVVNSTQVVNNTTQVTWTSIGQIRLFGIPEYDPEAYGTDVTIKSKANVPNTDWLEVYFDAKGLSNGAVTDPISGLGGTTINGTATNVTVSDGAFVFDGSSSYITGGTTSISGNHNHSFSCWLKPTSANSGYKCIGYLFYSGSSNTTTGLFLNNNRPVFLTWGNNLISDHTLAQNEWVHITAVYDGTGRTIYVNCKQIDSDTYSSYNINASATLLVGASSTTPGEVFGGSMANFRVFNRALTTDEIYQLYAYQKEEFGHGDLSMTLKAGRLGIGTSEPRAALDINSGGVRLNQELWVTPAKRNDTVRVSTNTLSFYEEGSWTPTLGAVATPTYTEQFGYYTRIGNIVHLVFRISVTGLNNGDGSGIHITLPYELANNNGHSAMCSFGYNNSLFDPNRSNGGANIGNNYIIPAQGGSGQTAVAIRYNNCYTSGTLLGFATYSLQVTK